MAMGAVLGVASILTQTAGSVMGQRYQSQQDKLRQRTAEVQAADTNAAYTEELNRTVSTIKAIRASAGVPADSPSTRSYIAEQARISDINRSKAVGANQLQAEAASNDAGYHSRLAGLTLLGGVAKAGGYAFSSG